METSIVSGADKLTPVADEQNPYPNLMKWVVRFFWAKLVWDLCLRDWAGLSLTVGMLLAFLGGKREQQMSRPVKVIWGIVMFSLIILSAVLTFQGLRSRGR